MTDYKKLVEALRERARRENEWYEHGGDIIKAAVDAIEELQAKVHEKDCFIGMLKVQIGNMEQQLPKHGEWISDLPNRLFENVNPWKCSVCGKHYHFREDYCPHCGAKMGVQDG